MKALIGTARNLLVLAGSNGEPIPAVEAIIITDEGRWVYNDAEGVLEEGRNEETVRFFVSAKGLRALAEDLLSWADEADAVLTARDEEVALASPSEQERLVGDQ